MIEVQQGTGRVIVPTRNKLVPGLGHLMVMVDDDLKAKLDKQVSNKRWGIPALLEYALEKIEREKVDIIVS
jgi:hypothetical protein